MRYRNARLRRKDALWIRTGGRCGYCGEKTEKKLRTRDHIVPRAKGGRTHDDNLIACCQRCNIRKSDFDLHEFRQIYFNGEMFFIEWLEDRPLVALTPDVIAAD